MVTFSNITTANNQFTTKNGSVAAECGITPDNIINVMVRGEAGIGGGQYRFYYNRASDNIVIISSSAITNAIITFLVFYTE